MPYTVLVYYCQEKFQDHSVSDLPVNIRLKVVNDL